MKQQHIIAPGVAVLALAAILVAAVFRNGTAWRADRGRRRAEQPDVP